MSVTPNTSSLVRLERETRAFGCPQLIALNGPQTEAHLNYLDLVQPRTEHTLLPHAIAEFQGRPLLYLLDDLDGASGNTSLHHRAKALGQLLANRSEHALLGIVRPGELTLYPVNLNHAVLDRAPTAKISVESPDAPLFFQKLATRTFSLAGQAQTPDYVFDEVHRLLVSADEELHGKIQPLEVLSITGRALFFRFLHDRRIVLPSELSDICPSAENLKDVFSDAKRAAATSFWLDETFNGDFLPLIECKDQTRNSVSRRDAYLDFFQRADKKTNGILFLHLEAIMRGWKHVGASSFQTTIDWDDLNFAHIPIGVLSQIYETFSRRWDVVQAEETSVYYTPKNIARILVEEALAGVDKPQNAVVLDPACGAGVFLVLAFRQLVRSYWKATGHRPDKNIIHGILYNQLRGFDVSESALRLAALALYITAIELSGTTRPPKILKFPKALQDEVLFNFAPPEASERRFGFVLGSLAPQVPRRFNGQFDVVVCNPPWTRLRPRRASDDETIKHQALNIATNQEFSNITRRALTARNTTNINVTAYKNPDNNPDLPFLWRSTEWAKPGGSIAMALPGRIILKQTDAGRDARKALFRGLRVTGILNGSDLEKTAVWPNMDLPFMLLFARNSVPPAHHQFSFLSPVRQSALCKRAEFRFDYLSAKPVSVNSVIEKPWLLKTLALGSVLDVEIVEKIAARKLPTISDIWANLQSGEGYNISDRLAQKSAQHLLDLPDLDTAFFGFKMQVDSLKTWQERHDRTTAHAPRDPTLYNPPLVIVPQTPGNKRIRPKAYLSENNPIAFSKSFYGYSTAGHENPTDLARLLYLVVHSVVWNHHYLTHSSRIGASYRTFLKQDLDNFFFPDPQTLTDEQWSNVRCLTQKLLHGTQRPWTEIDELVFDLYGLNSHDLIVIKDTLRFGAPYRSARVPAEKPPEDQQVMEFCQYLVEMVQPFVRFSLTQLFATETTSHDEPLSLPWRFISFSPHRTPATLPTELLAHVIQEANRTASSRIIVVAPKGGLIIGLLNQARFWSLSRARLCGLHIVRQHLGAFQLR